MDIEQRDYCPDSTYFRTGDVEPDIVDGKLIVYDGNGSRRGWGIPGNHTYIIYNDDRLTSVVVGFYHKHGGGQFWRYYVAGKQRTWSQLDIEDQAIILEHYAKVAPKFARAPGLLKSHKAKPLTRVERENCIGYKDLIIKRDDDNKIVGIKSPSRGTNWYFDENGWVCEAHEIPDDDNHSGVYITFKAPVARAYSGELCKVILSGTIIIGERGARGQFARLLEVV